MDRRGGLDSIRRLTVTILAVLSLGACALPPPAQVAPPAAETTKWDMTPEEAARTFAQVVENVMPVAESVCRTQTTDMNCEFLVAVDTNPRAPANAYQTIDKDGRPVITFTITLIASVQNADEIAFIIGHEASHHIAGHLTRQRLNEQAGAEIFGELAQINGGSARDIASAQELGAALGARSYAKEFELEADRLGTIITKKAGYDPLRGARFFTRIPDPGDEFLGTHPPNAARTAIVERTVQEMGG